MMAVCDRKGSGRWVEVSGGGWLHHAQLTRFPPSRRVGSYLGTYPTYGIVELIQVVCDDWRRAQRVHRVGRWVGRLPLQVGSGPVVVDLVASSAVSVVVVGASSLAAIMALSSASSQPYSSASSSESAISS